jgi:hypothetical protein
LNVTTTTRLVVKFTVHTGFVDGESQFCQLPKVEPLLAAAVNVTVPLAKLPIQDDAQLRPRGELVTVPVPLPWKVTARVLSPPPPPEPAKQVTFAVI